MLYFTSKPMITKSVILFKKKLKTRIYLIFKVSCRQIVKIVDGVDLYRIVSQNKLFFALNCNLQLIFFLIFGTGIFCSPDKF